MSLKILTYWILEKIPDLEIVSRDNFLNIYLDDFEIVVQYANERFGVSKFKNAHALDGLYCDKPDEWIETIDDTYSRILTLIFQT